MNPLKQSLEKLAVDYHAAYLQTDPVAWVHRYSDPLDQEVVGWLASAFAYGRVPQIFRTLENILSKFSKHPYNDLKEWQPDLWQKEFANFVHRFANAGDLLTLLFVIHMVIKEFGSIGQFFRGCHQESDGTVKGMLTMGIQRLHKTDFAPVADWYRERFWHLLPSPQSGSACKRWNMFLRWMVRPRDGIDLGLWHFLLPSHLLLPLDTHTARISRFLGFTQKNTPSWAMAEEVTQALRELDPEDPTKYDFALSRLGILRICPGKKNGELCRNCPLVEFCQA